MLRDPGQTETCTECSHWTPAPLPPSGRMMGLTWCCSCQPFPSSEGLLWPLLGGPTFQKCCEAQSPSDFCPTDLPTTF